MAYFFNGRLWTTPAVMSQVDDSAMYNPNLNVGNVVAFLGRSTGGEPNTPLAFGSAAEAAAALRSGDLVDAITRAFDPSAETVGPATVLAIRVNPATRSTLALVNAADATVITLTSTDYGLYTEQIKVKVEAATNTGRKLTTQFVNSYYSQDDVYRNAMSILYDGEEETATVSVTNSQLILKAAGSTVATIALATYPTIQEVVDRINSVADFTAEVLDGNGSKPSLNGLDTITDQSVLTEYTVTAHLQAIVDWFNGVGEGYVTATRAPGAGLMPAAIPFTYLAGGVDGTITNTEWSNAFTKLQEVDAQWVVPLSSDASIHAMADAHCAYMSTIGQKERRAFVGSASGTTDAAAIVLAKAINSDRTALVHLGMYDFNAAGDLTLYEPFILAAMIAGAFSGVNPGVAMTNKSLKIRGLERKLRNPTDTDALIIGGVLAVEDTATGYRVVKSISTWLTNDNYNRVEVSTGAAIDFTARNVRQALAPLKGAPGNPITLGQAVERADSALKLLSQAAPIGVGVLVGDATNPPYKNITARLTGDVLEVSFQASPVIPVNFIPVTIFAVPYSGTASA